MSNCDARSTAAKLNRLEDIQVLWSLYQENQEAYNEKLGRLNEYSLEFCYVEPYTFPHQRAGYYSWLLSTGGPQEEFRFFMRKDETAAHDIEFWFIHARCSQGIVLRGADYQLLQNILSNYFCIGG